MSQWCSECGNFTLLTLANQTNELMLELENVVLDFTVVPRITRIMIVMSGPSRATHGSTKQEIWCMLPFGNIPLYYISFTWALSLMIYGCMPNYKMIYINDLDNKGHFLKYAIGLFKFKYPCCFLIMHIKCLSDAREILRWLGCLPWM